MPETAPTRPAADRNLLFGILALQMDFITREALIHALHAWVQKKDKPLGSILLAHDALRPDRRQLVESLVQAHLEAHGDQPARSLAALSALDTLRQDLAQVADPDLDASLARVPRARPAEVPPNARRPLAEEDSHPTRYPPEDSRPPRELSVGAPTSAGLRFRILRPHARGGLGQVSVALDRELNREVALKEIQARFADDPDSRARFLLEAEITGGLEHPGIVPVHGLGTYPDGSPFYAMRFIKGDSLQEAITRFHRAEKPSRDPGERALALRELLGRFVAVCQAVAYAHSRGILHRDLKPGNVMLGKFGETLLVDWGLAKPLGRVEGDTPSPEGPLQPASASGAAPTQLGATIGTPAYMSPEQAAGQLDQLGPASDVYSLGATLYCLLTGRAAFADPDLGALLQRVQRGDFPRPRQVQPHVPAALEAVCLKAMARRPEDRYGGALALAADVERWLADEPVTSYREPLRVRAARWVRRHPAVATGAVVLLLTATAGLGVGLYFVNAEKDRTEAARQGEAAQRQVADQERKQALDKAAEAKEVLEFFQDKVLAAARPESQDGGLGINATIRAAVDQAEPTIADAFRKRPLVEASIRRTLGTTYWYLGEHQAAIAQLERALALYRDHLGPAHPDTLATMNNLANAYGVAGQLDQALPLLEQALAKTTEQVGPDHLDTLTSIANLAVGYHSAGQWDKALPLFEQVLAKRQEKLGPDHRDTLISISNLAEANLEAGRLEQALRLHQQALAKRREKLGPDHRDTLYSMNNLASAYQAAGQLDQALPLFEQAVAGFQKKLGRDHPSTLTTMNNLADALQQKGEFAQAEQVLRECLTLGQQKQPDAWITFRTRSQLGASLLGQKRYAEAEPLLLAGYEGMKQRQARIAAPGKKYLTEALERLVQLYDAWGKPDEAKQWRAEREKLPKSPEPPKAK